MTMERDILRGHLEKMPIEQLRYIAAQFLEWHSSDGCPVSEMPDGREYAAAHPDCDSEEPWDCTDYCGCWVDYYAWEWEKKQKEAAE